MKEQAGDKNLPDWDGDPARWKQFETSAKWFAKSLRWSDRALAASRIATKLLHSRNHALRTLVASFDPDEFEYDGGHLALFKAIELSPLGKLPIPDAAHKIKHFYKDLARRKGETLGAFLIRENEVYEQMLDALDRLVEEMTVQKVKKNGDEQFWCGCCASLRENLGSKLWKGELVCQGCWAWYADDDQTRTTEDGSEYYSYSTSHRSSSRASQAKSTVPSYHSDKGKPVRGHQTPAALEVLRGFFLLEAMGFSEKEKQDVRVVTSNRVDYPAISNALKERWEDRAIVQRDFGPRAVPRYRDDKGKAPAHSGQVNWTEHSDAAIAESSWDEEAGGTWNEPFDANWSQQGANEELWQQDDGWASWEQANAALADDPEVAAKQHELFTAEALAIDAQTTLQQARDAVAAVHRDRGFGGSSPPSTTSPNNLPGKGSKCKSGDRPKVKSKGKGKYSNFKGYKGKSYTGKSAHLAEETEEVHYLGFSPGEAYDMFPVDGASGLSSSEVMADCGATTSAGGSEAVTAMIAAIVKDNPDARIFI